MTGTFTVDLFYGVVMTENIKKVLIVDDEYFIGKLIQKLIKWNEKGLECAKILDNGADAVDYIKNNDLDIVITDIKMPGVSGLDLIRETRTISDKIQYIIISGYREFEYARTAMKYGTGHYVLKPINAEDLNEALDDVIKIIEDMEDKEAKEKKLIAAVESSEKIIKANILKNMIENEESEHTALFNSESGLFRAINIKLDYEDISQIDKNADKLTVSKIVEITDRILGNKVNEVISCDKEYMNIYFLFNYNIAGEIKNILNHILIKINEYLLGFERYRATIGVGNEKDKFNDMKISIKEAHEAIEKRLGLGINRIIYYQDVKTNNETSINIKYIDIFKKYNDEIRKNIEAFSTDKVKYIVNSIFKEISETDCKNINEIYLLPEWSLRLFSEYSDEKIRENNEEMTALLNSCWNINECKKVLLQYMIECIDYIKNKSEVQVLRPVRVTVSYIEENFREKITIEEAAKTVDLNPIYLGSLFKKETGLSFSNYVIKVRIDLAKKLLLETNYTIAAIGAEVGYKDTRYFSQLFAKTVGIKPALYRRLHS